MTTKASLLAKFMANIPAWRSASLKYRYPNLASHFIELIGVKEVYTKADAITFLNYLSNSGRSKNTVRWSAYVLRKFYEALGLDFPLKEKELPPLPNSSEISAPVFSVDEVQKLIKVVREKGTPEMKVYLALSTTYGLRRSEMEVIQKSDVALDKILIHTTKRGAPRWHIIPNEIGFIAVYPFEPITGDHLRTLFLRAQRLARAGHEAGEGYHAIRRQLVTSLLGVGVPPPVVYDFMRWKLSSRLGIMGEYTKLDHNVVDRAVFKSHPFLEAWR